MKSIITKSCLIIVLLSLPLVAKNINISNVIDGFPINSNEPNQADAVGKQVIKLLGQETGDIFGNPAAFAGDVNGDGNPDVIVSAQPHSEPGKAYLYFGGENMDRIPDLIFNGKEPNDGFARSISTAGDVNGDGYADIIIGIDVSFSNVITTGAAYIFLGGRHMDNEPDYILTGETVYSENILSNVSSAGDVNGDGFNDVILSVVSFDDAGHSAGDIYLFWGGPAMDNVADVHIPGQPTDESYRLSVSSAGDLNGDGYDDILIGSYSDGEAGHFAGKVSVYFGGKAMDSSADLILLAEAADDWFGWSVSSAGDLNGDGFSDIIIGACSNDEKGYDAGKVYVYFGGLSPDNQPDLSITGETSYDYFGYSVAVAGDVNSDGYSDVIIGAKGNDENGENTGKVYILYGGPSMDDIADATMLGESAFSYFGVSVSPAGDINGDGYDDVLVGTQSGTETGAAYIFLNKLSGNINFANVTLRGEITNDNFGRSLASAGDVNGDGYDDFIVGASGNDDAGTSAGKAYIFWGGPLMDNNPDVTLLGENNYDGFGCSVASAGDVNGDGYADVIIGASGYDGTYTNQGKAYIYFGGASMDNLADITITGEAENYYFGGSVASAGDVNGDGFNDVIIGASEAFSNSGKIYIYFGGKTMDGFADVTLTGFSDTGYFGKSVSSAGDVNGDGYADVIIGEPNSSSSAVEAGKCYILFGGVSMDNEADLVLNGENPGDQFGRKVASAGDVNGDGFDDVIIGANYNDDAGQDAGKVYLYYGSNSMNNVPDVTFLGEGSFNYLGSSLSSAGDVNDDGYADLLIGAYGYANSKGKAYLYFGGRSIDTDVNITISGRNESDALGISVASAGDVNGDGFPDIIIGSNRDGESNRAGNTFIYFSNGLQVAPNIFYARDVPFDQGGKVLLKWSKSVYDSRDFNKVTKYLIQRSEKPSGTSAWETLDEVPALQQIYYSYTASTLYDSSASTTANFYYRIIAATKDQSEFWASQPALASSKDNLSPAAIQGFTGGAVDSEIFLSWNQNKEKDLKEYHLYRSVSIDVDLDTTDVYAVTTDTTFTEEAPSSNMYYFVRAVDIHDNAGPSEQWLYEMTGINNTIENQPQKYFLSQNYPNPFNPVTSIRYQITSPDKVELTVFNTIGQKVKVLVNKKQTAGNYRVTFNGGSLPSGVYFYRLKTKGIMLTRKMLLVK